MGIAVAPNFVSGGGNAPDQMRVTLCDPAENKKSAFSFILRQQIESSHGGRLHA
jgi:hypothetical protein